MAERPRGCSGRPRRGPAGPPQWAMMAAFREAAARRGSSLDAIAREAGLGDLVARIEAGERELTLEAEAALCKVLDVRLSELIARAEELPNERREP